jgi:bifunctional non-homologous end joining protein LigD
MSTARESEPHAPTRHAKRSHARSAERVSAKATERGSAKTPRRARGSEARAHSPQADRAHDPSGKAHVDASPLQHVELDVSRLEITHPDRVLYPEQGITKRDLMVYYARVARWMLPHLVQRPLMLVRCPEGEGQQCFHQKHPSAGMPRAVQQVVVEQKKGPEPNLMVTDVEGLLGLVQVGALEIHTWGSRAGSLDTPDQLVFDLDPEVGLPWERIQEAALALRVRLEADGLTCFVKATGGKGLHLVVPVTPSRPWEEIKQYARRTVDTLVAAAPQKYVATMAKRRREGKIFLDYLRNASGATSICVFSTRARQGAPLAVPIDWQELESARQPLQVPLRSLETRWASLEVDPWRGFEDARASIPAT